MDQTPAGDIHFPAVDWPQWHETARDPHDGFTFVSYRAQREITAK